MTDKERLETKIGLITEALPNAFFRVKLKDEELLAYLSGKMRLNRIKVIIGDSVEVVLDPYGGKGRIIRRLDSRKTI
ncbi:MAG: translation initiation factor IF-1 [Candidatus Paceibacterota bacterium]|jgi:translation initiation factor IF-1